jgi:hypothetical protein
VATVPGRQVKFAIFQEANETLKRFQREKQHFTA